LDQRQPFGFLQYIPRAAVSEGGKWRRKPCLQPNLGVESFRIARLQHDLLDQVRQNLWWVYFVGAGHAAFWSRDLALATLGMGVHMKTPTACLPTTRVLYNMAVLLHSPPCPPPRHPNELRKHCSRWLGCSNPRAGRPKPVSLAALGQTSSFGGGVSATGWYSKQLRRGGRTG